MDIKKVWLDESEDECISCGLCETIAPMVFRVPDKMEVIEGVNFSEYVEEIKEAAENCPTNVIKYE
ncbi:MAG: ferredoxin [Bacteroidales bacterium]|nr:ferredoxin [Bacteroidales bacterium]MCK9499605.1 ferredoxin [Bacteroidales bacterium]MDY0314480.1 ferredoxin [Bacteroidales bacterium]NLB85697.1 ferredoxin [Bacteroidales bacterium]